MPIVCTPDGKVINGIGRLEMLAELKVDTCDVVYISEDEAKFADAMMNLLTMEFDIHTRYADLLRYNSFRRARRVREELGHDFVFAVHGNKPCHTFDIFNPAQQAKWRKEHGNTILDFGAGHLTETNILNAAGFDCTPFEPYHIGVSEMSGNVCAKCENVRRIPWERLVEALQFEFNLPYPDGSRMELIDEAISAFKHRYEILG